MWAARPAEGGDVRLLEGRAPRLIEEHVHAVGPVLEAQVARPRTLPVVGADRDHEARLHVIRRRSDRKLDSKRFLHGHPGRIGETRREGLVAEAAARDSVRDLQRLTEAKARGIHDVDVVGAGLRPALLSVDVAVGALADSKLIEPTVSAAATAEKPRTPTATSAATLKPRRLSDPRMVLRMIRTSPFGVSPAAECHRASCHSVSRSAGGIR